MIDYYTGNSVVVKDVRPIYTMWSHDTVRKSITSHKRHSRRTYRQYLKTGNINDYNRSQRKITRYNFD